MWLVDDMDVERELDAIANELKHNALEVIDIDEQLDLLEQALASPDYDDTSPSGKFYYQ